VVGPCITMKRKPLQTRRRDGNVNVKFLLGDVLEIQGRPSMDSCRIKSNTICIQSRDCSKVKVPMIWLATPGGSLHRDVRYLYFFHCLR
jgi:hypothetical protein